MSNLKFKIPYKESYRPYYKPDPQDYIRNIPKKETYQKQRTYVHPTFTREIPQPFLTPPLNPLLARDEKEIKVLKRRPKRSPRKRQILWLYEEVTFSMNKLSLTGIILGLMFFGVLFFTAGFVVAVATVGSGTSSSKYNHEQWGQLQTQNQSGSQSFALGGVAGGIAGKVLGKEAAHLQAKFLNAPATKVISKIPAPLQPFAAHAQLRAQGKVTHNVQQGIWSGSHKIMPPTAKTSSVPSSSSVNQVPPQQGYGRYSGSSSYPQQPYAQPAQQVYPQQPYPVAPYRP